MNLQLIALQGKDDTQLEFNFSGKNVLITGGSIGLGFETAKLFVRNGADVIICSRNINELESAASKLSGEKINSSQQIRFMKADVGNTGDIDSLFAYSGTPDVLVTCAGLYGPIGAIENNSWDEWEYTLRVNLFGTVYCIRKAVSLWKSEHRKGKIVCLSGGGATKGMPNFSSYAASKSAVVRTVETIALENKDSGIYINAVAPGALNTRMLDQALNAGQEAAGSDTYRKLIAQKENGGASIENAAELIAYLASDMSDGITGKLISAVWDDWKEFHEHKKFLENPEIYTLRRIIPDSLKEERL